MHKKVCIFFTILFFICGTLSIYLLFIAYKDDLYMWKNGIRTTGVIVQEKFEIVGSGQHSGRSFIARGYYFDKNNIKHNFRSEGNILRSFKKGENVTIIYDPKNPDRAIIEEELRTNLNFSDNFLLFLFPFIFYGGAIYFYWWRNKMD